jgi:Dyp-type peroxidase family
MNGRSNEPQLEVNDIQGDVLVGLQKDFEWFVFFTIDDVEVFKDFLRHRVLPLITTLKRVIDREDVVRAHKAQGNRSRLGLTGVNIAFSMLGLKKLGAPDLGSVRDAAFTAGLAARAADLNDPNNGPGSPENWKVGGRHNEADGVVLITGPSARSVDKILDQLFDDTGGLTVIYKERGATRPLDRGHEHFGFLDGVSQPGIRGEINGAFPSKKFLQEQQNPRDPGQALPGADLIWPGAFVFGYPGQNAQKPDEPTPPVDGGAPWMRNGSLMVFRRLNQLVPEFDEFLDNTATQLDMDPQLLGARAVGRWKSGAPLLIDPLQDDPILGANPLLNNDFDFDVDSAGRRCPFAAHIRKAYPRNDLTPAQGTGSERARREASENNTETHRILRRGIPFGEEVTDAEKDASETRQERGLMFVCYQTSIVNQFEFIIRNWVNNPNFAPAGNTPGFDPLLGQDGAHAPRNVEGLEPSYPSGPRGRPVTLPIDFIVPTAGGYFFMPSLSAIAMFTT